MSTYTPGPWDYVPGTEHHGPYITSEFGSTIADFYTMTQPSERSTANGGPSKPVPFLHEMAEPNARLAAAAPELLACLQRVFTEQCMSVENARLAQAVIAKATGAP